LTKHRGRRRSEPWSPRAAWCSRAGISKHCLRNSPESPSSCSRCSAAACGSQTSTSGG